MSLTFTPFSGKSQHPDLLNLDGHKVSSKVFIDILLHTIKEEVFTREMMLESGCKDIVNIKRWQNRQIDLCCVYRRDDENIQFEMAIEKWEYLIKQSILFDCNIFINEVNSLYSRYGWYVSGFTLIENNVDISFRMFAGNPVKYLPRHIYYFTAVWNKELVMSQGLLPEAKKDNTGSKHYCDYDVFLKTFDIDYIRSVANSMYEIGCSADISLDVGLEILPIIVFRIDTRLFSTGRIPYCEEMSGALRFFTYVPPAAIDEITYEDHLPDYKQSVNVIENDKDTDGLIDRAKKLAERMFQLPW